MKKRSSAPAFLFIYRAPLLLLFACKNIDFLYFALNTKKESKTDGMKLSGSPSVRAKLFQLELQLTKKRRPFQSKEKVFKKITVWIVPVIIREIPSVQKKIIK